MNANNDSGMGSVTLCIQSLKAGDQKAAGTIWGRFSASLVRLSRKRLGSAPRTVNDEEDVALMPSIACGECATAGRFPQLASRSDLWRLLAAIAGQKAVDQLRHERRRSAAAAEIARLSTCTNATASHSPSAASPLPTPPWFSTRTAGGGLDRLRDDELRRIAIWKLEGEGNNEIARRLGCGLRSVERKLGVIRRIWLAE